MDRKIKSIEYIKTEKIAPEIEINTMHFLYSDGLSSNFENNSDDVYAFRKPVNTISDFTGILKRLLATILIAIKCPNSCR